jgi:hypothetical protein
MSHGSTTIPAPDTVRCPTCRATQDWSDTCRRCKSDLRLLREFTESYERSRRAFVVALDKGDARAASRHAIQCHSLRPNPESRCLLALAALLRRDWQTAADLATRDL